MTQAIGPTSQQRLTPYLSRDMLKYHRRRGVRYDDLVPQGSPADQDASLAELIEAASSRVDTIVLQTMAATLDTVLDTVNIDRRGYARVHPRYRPVIGVTAVLLGSSPTNLQALASLSGVGVQRDRFSVPVGPVTPLTSSQGPIQFGGVAAPMDQAWIQYTYCNGFPVTTLTASSPVGATSISVLDTTGIIEGATVLTVYAGKNRVRFLAGSVSTAPAPGLIGTGPGTVGCAPLPFSLAFDVTYPAMVSAMPSDVIEATALCARGFVKLSGGGNISASTTTGNRKERDPLNAGDDFEAAEVLLAPYMVPVE